MECPFKECKSANDCAIIEITKKIPKKKESCSYYSPIKEEKKQNPKR